MSLQDVRAGDEVAIRPNGSYQKYERKIVDKVTPTQIVIGAWKYNKKSGRRIGDGNVWSEAYLYEMTPKIRDEIRHYELACALNGKNWIAYPLETLETVWAAVEAARKAKEAGG